MPCASSEYSHTEGVRAYFSLSGRNFSAYLCKSLVEDDLLAYAYVLSSSDGALYLSHPIDEILGGLDYVSS